MKSDGWEGLVIGDDPALTETERTALNARSAAARAAQAAAEEVYQKLTPKERAAYDKRARRFAEKMQSSYSPEKGV